MSEPTPPPSQWLTIKHYFKDRHAAKHRLTKAAGISEVTLVCHSDTWNFIRDQLWSRARYRLPESAEHGLLNARLSGVDIVTVLSVMRRIAMPWTDEFFRRKAVAWRVYMAISEVVDKVDPSASAGTPVPPIVIDDKIRED